MSWSLLIWFSAGRLVFGLIDRWRWRLVIAEALSLAVFFLITLLFLRPMTPLNQGVLIAGLFLATSVVSRLIARCHPIEATDPDSRPSGTLVGLGIIDFVWLAIPSAVLGLLCFVLATHPFKQSAIVAPYTKEYLQAELANATFLLGKAIDSVFLLGGALAGCMAILWAGEIWRQRGEAQRRQYFFTTIAATRMVVAYFVVAAAAYYWVGVPLYNRINKLSELLN